MKTIIEIEDIKQAIDNDELGSGALCECLLYVAQREYGRGYNVDEVRPIIEKLRDLMYELPFDGHLRRKAKKDKSDENENNSSEGQTATTARRNTTRNR